MTCMLCMNEHDPNLACAPLDRNPPPMKDDLFDNATPSRPDPGWALGPVFMAQFESEDSCCGEGIVPGEDIRADGQGGWIHADTTCERLASE